MGSVTLSATVDEGIARILDQQGPLTPSEHEIGVDLSSILGVLEIELPADG